MRTHLWPALVLGFVLLSLCPVFAQAVARTPPVQIVSFQYRDSMIPNQPALALIDGQVVIRNVSRLPLTHVDIIVHIQDGYHNDLAELGQSVGTLAPGETAVFPWHWMNYSSFYVVPQAEVRTDPQVAHARRIVVFSEAVRPAATQVERGTLNTYQAPATPPSLTYERWQAPESPGAPPGYAEAIPPVGTPRGY